MFYSLAEFEIMDPDGYVLCLAEELEDSQGLSTPQRWQELGVRDLDAAELPRPCSGQRSGPRIQGDNMAKAQAPKDIDEYIARFPGDVQAILQKVRTAIRTAAPDATETISYQMPAFKQHGILVYLAGWKQHIGLYPPVSGVW